MNKTEARIRAIWTEACELKANTRAVLTVLLIELMEGPTVPIASLMDRSKMSRSGVRSHLRELERLGWITIKPIVRESGQEASRYTVVAEKFTSRHAR